jgi:hypothetical protein
MKRDRVNERERERRYHSNKDPTVWLDGAILPTHLYPSLLPREQTHTAYPPT